MDSEDISFQAMVVEERAKDTFARSITTTSTSKLPPGDVLIQVFYSSLNYKDALSASGNKGVTKIYPHTPGIDAAGRVVHSSSENIVPGDEVIVTGYDLGMNTPGGFGQYIRVPQSWVVPKPAGLSLLESMQLGTAGFTAALCAQALQDNNIYPEKGPVLVTGASGGVGSIAILLLQQLGYEVTAVTGKVSDTAYFDSLGISRLLDRHALLTEVDKPLLPARWAGVVDTVGGDLLAIAIKSTRFDGVVTSCGNASSNNLPLTVFPFILRGVHLQGIYSANCPMEKRLHIWGKLAREWKIKNLARICRNITLDQLPLEIEAMLAGKSKGRCVVALEDEI